MTVIPLSCGRRVKTVTVRERLKKIVSAVRKRLSLRVLIGGPAGLFAWGLSGAGALAVLIWGLKTIAWPLLMIKTASWGIWSAGVLRESQLRKKAIEAAEHAARDGDRSNGASP
ncbi:MAG TPA: hypothetical protein ENI90_09420 [Methylothermaceae bacterium]|nr:hypothetical protein [Methylothermaceae bacterium]